MATEGRHPHLTEDQVRERLQETLPKLQDWSNQLARPWTPEVGSPLAADDLAAPDVAPSAKARMTLAIGTDHLTTAVQFMLNAGPSMYSMRTLLRTAMLAGAQAIHVLEPDDPEERVKRHRRVEGTSVSYLKPALAEIVKTPSEDLDLEALQRDQRLADERLSKNRGTVNPTRLIRDAVKYVFQSPPDPEVEASCMVAWQTGSCTAHALPWELELRPSATAFDVGNTRTIVVRATLTDIQDSLGFATSFLEVGWQLLAARARSST